MNHSVFNHNPFALSCSLVTTLDYEDRCNYVRTTPECGASGTIFLDSTKLFYCAFDPRSTVMEVICTILLLSICTTFFLILGTAADNVFCPALKVAATLLRMNEQMAGMTLIAFGNAAPDFFTSLVTIAEKDVFMFSNLMGAGIYVMTMVGGIICLVYPFDLGSTLVVRDSWFLLLQVLYIDFAGKTGGRITVVETLGIFGIYIVYLIVAYGDQFLLKREIKALQSKLAHSRRFDRRVSNMYDVMHREASFDILSGKYRQSVDISYTARMSAVYYTSGRNAKLWTQFLRTINPFERDSWYNGNFVVRALLLIRIPINLLIFLLVPIIDYERDLHGWSKLLNCIQIVTLPVCVISILYKEQIWGIPVSIMPVVVTLPIAIYVFVTTRTGTKPRFHALIAIYSIFGAVAIIYTCANATVNLLYVFGLVTHSSTAFLGCTLLAFGNSIGDMVSNVALARTGYQRMGYSACYGGPFFNITFAVGLSYIYKALISPTGAEIVIAGPLEENCFIFFVIIQGFTSIWAMTTGFRVRSVIGIFLIMNYLIFIIYLFLTEKEVIQSYSIETEIFAFGDYD